MTKTALAWQEWRVATRSAHLTIGDITKLGPGTRLRLLIQDSNIADSVHNLGHDDGQPRLAQHFFSGLADTFTYSHSLTGVMEWHWGNSAADNGIFTFQLFSKEHQIWYPLDDFGVFKPEKTHWMNMPLTTKVGWRGPAMLWSDLNDQPYIYTGADEM